jgi:hypothetical protein
MNKSQHLQEGKVFLQQHRFRYYNDRRINMKLDKNNFV